jgi:hypothetical protein
VNASIARIPDGTSNTLMFTEVSGGLNDTYSCPTCTSGFGWAAGWTWPAGGSIATAFGTCPDTSNQNCTNFNDPSPAALGLTGQLPASFHTGGIWNAAFADGSCRSLRSPIDFGLLLGLGGYNDGDVINDLQ